MTALITPFTKQNKVDLNSLGKLVSHQMKNGIQGFVVCGTTGESPTLSWEEKFQILDLVCQKLKGKQPLLFGSGTNDTHETIELSLEACERPIDGLLVVVPYYNNPPQEGLLAHFRKVADQVPKPILLYNVPGRTGLALQAETIIELAQHPNIVGIKEANGDLNSFSMYKNQVPEDFALLSGDDQSCVNFCLLGGHGVVSVCSHIAPKAMVEWITRALNRDESVREAFRQQDRWIKSLYVCSNPIPVKMALTQKGLIRNPSVRLPLVEMNQELKEKFHLGFQNFEDLLDP